MDGRAGRVRAVVPFLRPAAHGAGLHPVRRAPGVRHLVGLGRAVGRGSHPDRPATEAVLVVPGVPAPGLGRLRRQPADRPAGAAAGRGRSARRSPEGVRRRPDGRRRSLACPGTDGRDLRRVGRRRAKPVDVLVGPARRRLGHPGRRSERRLLRLGAAVAAPHRHGGRPACHRMARSTGGRLARRAGAVARLGVLLRDDDPAHRDSAPRLRHGHPLVRRARTRDHRVCRRRPGAALRHGPLVNHAAVAAQVV